MTKFIKELFKNPTKEYRGAPFWAWNGKLNKSVIKDQIDIFRKMGFGGFHIHSRIGLKTPYMQDEFMECIKYCNEYAKQNDMLTYLYDEDKWPSGYGGGAVTQNTEFRARYLLFSPVLYENDISMERFGEKEELLGALLFLLSNDAASFVNGVVIPVDGGFSAYRGV